MAVNRDVAKKQSDTLHARSSTPYNFSFLLWAIVCICVLHNGMDPSDNFEMSINQCFLVHSMLFIIGHDDCSFDLNLRHWLLENCYRP